MGLLPWSGLVGLGVFAPVLLLTRYVSLGSLLGIAGAAVLFVVAAVVWGLPLPYLVYRAGCAGRSSSGRTETTSSACSPEKSAASETARLRSSDEGLAHLALEGEVDAKQSGEGTAGGGWGGNPQTNDNCPLYGGERRGRPFAPWSLRPCVSMTAPPPFHPPYR